MSLPQDRSACPECRAELEGFETPGAGVNLRCPACGKEVRLPAVEIVQAPALPEALGAPAPGPRRRRRHHHRADAQGRKSALPLILLASGVLLALLAAMLLSAAAANRMLGGRENPLAARDPGPSPSEASGADAAAGAADATAIAIKDLFQITSQSAHSAPEGDGPISALAFAPDGKHLLCVRPEAPEGRRYQVLDRVAGRIAVLAAAPPSGTAEPALFVARRGPDGDSIRLYGPKSEGAGAPGAYVWDPDSGKSERITGPPREFLALALAPDGVTAADGERLPSPARALTRLTRLDSDLTRANPAGPVLDDRAAVRLRFSDDGGVLAGEFPPEPGADSPSPSVKAWRVPGGEPLGPGAEGSLVALLDGGKVLVTAAGEPGVIELLAFRGTADGSLAGTIDPRLGHAGAVIALAFHPRGSAFATAGGAGELLVKGRSDGAPLAALTGLGSSPARAIAFSADGSLLAAADGRGRICIWNLGRLEYPSPSAAPSFTPAGPGTVAAAPPAGRSPSPAVHSDPANSIPPAPPRSGWRSRRGPAPRGGGSRRLPWPPPRRRWPRRSSTGPRGQSARSPSGTWRRRPSGGPSPPGPRGAPSPSSPSPTTAGPWASANRRGRSSTSARGRRAPWRRRAPPGAAISRSASRRMAAGSWSNRSTRGRRWTGSTPRPCKSGGASRRRPRRPAGPGPRGGGHSRRSSGLPGRPARS
jgi:hypothetical protein